MRKYASLRKAEAWRSESDEQLGCKVLLNAGGRHGSDEGLSRD